MLFGEWLDATKTLQSEAFGVDFEKLQSDPEALADFFLYNLLALHDEVSEVAGEVGWKPWADNRGFVRKEEALSEVVDVLHFVANILCALDVLPMELEGAYQSKMTENRRRQTEGYHQR